MTDRSRPNTAIVLRWLTKNESATFTIGDIETDLELTRRQITTALHGLAGHGLEGQLENVGRGTWRYVKGTTMGADETTGKRPAQIEAVKYSIFDDGIGRTEVPLGWSTSITIISKITGSQGTRYTAITESGTYIQIEPLFGFETLGSAAPTE